MGREDQHRALTLYSSSPVITNTCSLGQSGRTEQYQAMIPDMVQQRRDRGQRILAVDFTSFPTSLLRDCIHPTNEGYKKFGDYWYDFITQIPREWINRPAGEPSLPIVKDPVSNSGPGMRIHTYLLAAVANSYQSSRKRDHLISPVAGDTTMQ
ncbi:hypothetical protein M419DRAFT_35989 [Trichoderma reesei RUT C-30]|uniref:SGNH hydrolase-type esterase domain-containing protein n=1 Tax=Hypocrea jecorina (strain ATCC 56765 / BCRC 32924 / NRRL 11460 / Rut C-30) TaxID=1344414 RepID=A0A024S8B4_HYPJR|nr:hypothetical protein M419DRAFT_35989 [Trichoderma reesei RUT C-30]